MRGVALYIIAYIPIALLYLLFSYMRYHRKAKKYIKIFRITLIKNSVPREIAKELSSEIKIIGIRDILKFRIP